MKKTLGLLIAIITLLALTVTAFAAGDVTDAKIFTARDLIAEYNEGRIKPTNLNVSEVLDQTGHYMRVSATGTSKHVIAWTLGEAVEPTFDALVIGVRTNYTDTSSSSKSVGLDFPKDSTFDYKNRYYAAKFSREAFELSDGVLSGQAVFKGLLKKFEDTAVPSVEFIKINPYDGKALTLADDVSASSIYTDIEYVAFFKNAADIESFDYDKYFEEISKDFSTFTITYLDRDGKKFAEEKAFAGSSFAPGKAPEIEYHKFAGWVMPDGTAAPKSFEVNADVTLKATYVYDEAAFLEAEREAAIAAGVNKRTDKPFISGYDGFEFRPDNNMTRAEACTVVTRLLVDENTLDNSKSTAFTDLNKNAWYYKYITYLEGLGYLKSYSGEFKPDQKITRAEFVELVYNMGKITGGDKNVSFKDVPATHPRYNVIMAAAKAGLVNGKTKDTFDPDGNIKRSEVVKVLCIALGRVPNTHSFDDVAVAGLWDINEKHWAYPYVIEAAFEHTAVEDKNGEEIWLSVKDDNNYYSPVPDGLIDKLNAEFDRRVKEIQNTKSEWTVAPGGTVWYFSTSGENMNDGKSPATPMKTLAKLDRMQTEGTIKPGDVVLFKRGDEWHDQLICADGITYSAYGEGAKPMIIPSVEADTAADWKETDVPGVYTFKYSLKTKNDIANIVFNDGECYGQRVVMDPADNTKTLTAGSDFMVSNGINVWYQPIRDFHGYATLAEIAAETAEADLMFYYDRATGDLYLYSRTGNPGDRFEAIDLVTYGHGVTVRGADKTAPANNIIIDNLCIKYAGSHGVSSGNVINLTVRNCEVGWIGGAHQVPKDLTSQTRYGNAIEVYGLADGFYVYNNYVHDCFDCGPTIQWSGDLAEGEKKVAKDIEIYSNVVWEGSLEVWFTTHSAPTDDTYLELRNCRLYDNLVTGSGHGWKAYNHYKFEWTSFYGGGGTNAYYNDCYVENNYFWGIKRHLMKSVPTTTVNGNGFEWRNNVIIHPDGEGSIGYMGKNVYKGKGEKTQFFYDKDTINDLVKNGAFGLNKFYYTPGDPANRRNIIQF